VVKLIGCKSLTISIFGIESEVMPATFVEADVFARKIRNVVTALKKADRVANGKGALPHAYFVSELKTGSAVVGLTEVPKAPA
jgi:hypothetical protein